MNIWSLKHAKKAIAAHRYRELSELFKSLPEHRKTPELHKKPKREEQL